MKRLTFEVGKVYQMNTTVSTLAHSFNKYDFVRVIDIYWNEFQEQYMLSIEAEN